MSPPTHRAQVGACGCIELGQGNSQGRAVGVDNRSIVSHEKPKIAVCSGKQAASQHTLGFVVWMIKLKL